MNYDMIRWTMPFYTNTTEPSTPRKWSWPPWETQPDAESRMSRNQGSDESQSLSSSVDADQSIDTLTAELMLKPPRSIIKDLEKRLEMQDLLITKLQDFRIHSRHYKITHNGITQTDSTNGLEIENKESFSQGTQTEEDESFSYFSSLDLENLKLYEENFHLTHEVEELRQKIASLESPSQHSLAVVRKEVCVDLYSPGGSVIIESIEDSFRKELQSKLHSKHIKVTYNLIHSHQEQKQLKEPSIVLCPSFSRLGTDVKSTFSAIQDCGRGTVLVVIQYKDEHRLNKVKSEQMLSSEYGHLSAILDMAYFNKKGFYDCQFNQNTLEELSIFVSNFAV